MQTNRLRDRRVSPFHRFAGRLAVLVGVAALLAGCAEMPVGPSVAVMPGANKPFDVFMQDDQLCRSWAAHAIGVPGHDAAAARMLGSTVAGAAIGALAGAAVGDHRSAGAGAAMGTLIGATAGANQGGVTAAHAQRRYDIAYQQCMYSKGNVVTGSPYGSYGWVPPPRVVPAPPPPPPPVSP